MPFAHHGSRVLVVDNHRLGEFRTQRTSVVVGRAESQYALVVGYGTPLQADLELEVRYGVVVETDCGDVCSRTNQIVRHRRSEIVLDIAPIVLGGDTYREVLERLPADARLYLRNVAVAGVTVKHATDCTPDILALLGHGHVIADAAVRREAQSESEVLRQRELNRYLVEIDCVFRILCGTQRIARLVVLGLAVHEKVALRTEIEDETLAHRRAVSRRVQRADHLAAAPCDTDAAHRAHDSVARRAEFAYTEHRVGRIGIHAAAALRISRRRHQH